jgi:hypothetical protein
MGWRCSRCGEFHEDLPMSYGVEAPTLVGTIPADEQSKRVDLSTDQCIIDGQYFFIRGCVELPVLDGSGPFTWGVWVSLNETNFTRMSELWSIEGREHEPGCFGWLCTALPCYPDTMYLKTNVLIRPIGTRPAIEIQHADHPLYIDQTRGITIDQIRGFAAEILHS